MTPALIALNRDVYRLSHVQELLRTMRVVEWERGLLGFAIGAAVAFGVTYLWRLRWKISRNSICGR
jgi:hypothetical protein